MHVFTVGSDSVRESLANLSLSVTCSGNMYHCVYCCSS